jgi:hypothetical protein
MFLEAEGQDTVVNYIQKQKEQFDGAKGKS